MESSSKIAANVLIICAILLIGTSLFTALTKKGQNTPIMTLATSTIPAQRDNLQNTVSTSTEESGTTTESITNSTSTSTLTNITTKSFIGKNLTWIKTTTKDGRVVTPKKVTAFTITLALDGSVKGKTDCNGFFGTYKITEEKLSFGSFGATEMFCEGAQEGIFMNSLQNVTQYLVDINNNLILTTASGSMMFK